MRDLSIEAKTTRINLCHPSPCEGFVQRLRDRKESALLTRNNRHKIAHRFFLGDGKCTSIRPLKPKRAGRAPIEIERPLNLKIGSQRGGKDAREIRQGRVRAKSQSGLFPRSNGCKRASCCAGYFLTSAPFSKIHNHPPRPTPPSPFSPPT